MRAARCQKIKGAPMTLEYWAGQHREASRGRELGFILGNGIHWWCVRQRGESPEEWEEVDSLGQSHIASWSCSGDLRDALAGREETVLVLYPDRQEEVDVDGEGKNAAKLKRISRRNETKAARQRAKEERKLATQPEST
eukprot:gb/GFBE01022894.1/.p1 GENE.gb/GFBE01022894.1/~~gb/GFBE01022894.1/.p1  ORF type:complete len:139 (+),score=20.15 gb/GFBE01022894.1/:1-417(+)